MKKIVNLIKENWSDPVWSKVIATIIIGTSTLIVTTGIGLFKYLINNVSWSNYIDSLFLFLVAERQIPLYVLILGSFVFLILTFKSIVQFLHKLSEKIFASINDSNDEVEPNTTSIYDVYAFENSSAFFNYRVSSAFPGVRDLTWFEDPHDIARRLDILLKPPLEYAQKSDGGEIRTNPIWWFRGHSSMYIETFKKLSRAKVLMNKDQMKIKRLAVYHGGHYWQDFVYLEVKEEKKTGLYDYSQKDIEKMAKSRGYFWEEYGILKRRLRSIFISREDYDDGATVVNGKVVDASDAELRIRYITPYNLLITAQDSPYNSNAFEMRSAEYFNGILKGETEPSDFFDFLLTLPRPPRYR